MAKIKLNIENQVEETPSVTPIRAGTDSISDIEDFANKLLEEEKESLDLKGGVFKRGTKSKPHKKAAKERRPRSIKPQKEEKEVEDLDELGLKIKKEYASLKMKKILMSSILITGVLSLVIFGTYNTFFKENKSSVQIMREFQGATGESLFRAEGVHKFLKENINPIMKKNSSFGVGVETYEIDPQTIEISLISKKSDFISNVYFSGKVRSNIGESLHNFVLPVSFDFDSYGYSPAGSLQISPNKSQNNIQESKNDALSFEGISKVTNEEANARLKTFINNFLMMLYNQKADISLYYTGAEDLGDESLTFNNITEFNYYSGHNKSGFNVVVKYSVSLASGVNYVTTSYMNIELIESGRSFIIKNIM